MKLRNGVWTNHDMLPDGELILSSHERKKLRKLMDMDSRSDKDWEEIQSLLKDVSLFSFQPVDERLQKKLCVSGIYKQKHCLLAFTSGDACTQYALRYEMKKVRGLFLIGSWAYLDMIWLADERRMNIFIDPSWDSGNRFLMYESKTSKLKSVTTL